MEQVATCIWYEAHTASFLNFSSIFLWFSTFLFFSKQSFPFLKYVFLCFPSIFPSFSHLFSFFLCSPKLFPSVSLIFLSFSSIFQIFLGSFPQIFHSFPLFSKVFLQPFLWFSTGIPLFFSDFHSFFVKWYFLIYLSTFFAEMSSAVPFFVTVLN